MGVAGGFGAAASPTVGGGDDGVVVVVAVVVAVAREDTAPPRLRPHPRRRALARRARRVRRVRLSRSGFRRRRVHFPRSARFCSPGRSRARPRRVVQREVAGVRHLRGWTGCRWRSRRRPTRSRAATSPAVKGPHDTHRGARDTRVILGGGAGGWGAGSFFPPIFFLRFLFLLYFLGEEITVKL